MNREHIRGFFDRKPFYDFKSWRAGEDARQLFLVALWHLFFIGIGFALGRITT